MAVVEAGLRGNAAGDAEGHGHGERNESDGCAGDKVGEEFYAVVIQGGNRGLRPDASLADSATGCMFHSIALGGSWGSGSGVPQSCIF